MSGAPLDDSLALQIQAAINSGYASAAGILGLPQGVYRPVGANQVISPQNLVATLPGVYSSDNYRFKAPNGFHKPTWTALIDGSITRPGDYLVGPQGTFYIAAQQSLLPILVVECNSVLSFEPSGSSAGTGSGATTTDPGFGDIGFAPNGLQSAPDTMGPDAVVPEPVAITGWPAAAILKSKGERPLSALPSSIVMPWFEVYLPSSFPAQIDNGDTLRDQAGHSYRVAGAELTDLGWRILAEQATD